MSIEILDTHLIVTLGKRRVSVPVEHEPDGEDGPDLIVHLDDIIHWLEPFEAEEVSLDDLAKIAEMIERYCDQQGIAVEFE